MWACGQHTEHREILSLLFVVREIFIPMANG